LFPPVGVPFWSFWRVKPCPALKFWTMKNNF
jgi:hypothetical protein